MKINNRIYTFEEVKENYSKYITDKDDLALIEKAYLYADKKHEGQMRKSGDPYVSHCIGVAYILTTLEVGPATICAGFLHDTIEDTDTTKEDIEKEFGEEIATLVEALTKVTRLSDYKNVEFTSENHRKIFVAMAKDVRVIIVKLADRLHNMRTLQFQPPAKQERISKETLEVYAPIAHRLGLYKIQTELEDISLYYTEPEKYAEIEKMMNEADHNAQQSLDKLKATIEGILAPTNIPFSVTDRVKSVYSIYKKMYLKHYTFSDIYDILALRILTKTEQNCYEILGYIHANFKPMPGRFKDYIAMPKANMYQSLHTTVVTEDGHAFEIQIRTEAMDQTAESGVAAHWRYKEGTHYDAKTEQVEIENQLHWFKDFVSIVNEENDDQAPASETVAALSHDIFDANIYVFTPKGNVICLPTGATPIDFAYRIHSDVGEHLTGARVNSVLVPISTELKTGDIVEVLTNKNASPNSEWLNIAKTNFAKSRIRKYLVKQNSDYVREDAIKKGRQMVLDAVRDRKLKLDINKAITKKVLDQFKCNSADDLFVMVNGKSVLPNQVIDAFDDSFKPKVDAEEMARSINSAKTVKKNKADTIVLENGDSIVTILANCCMPIPGDDIVGFVSTGQGVKVHRCDCPNVLKHSAPERQIAVKWNDAALTNSYFPVDLAIECHDRDGLLVDVLNLMQNANAKMNKVNAKYHSSINTTTITMTLLVQNTASLEKYIHTLSTVKGVFEIRRITR